MMQTPDSPGKSIKMDMKTNPGFRNKQRISVATQTDSRHKDENSQDRKQPDYQTVKSPKKNQGLTFGQKGKLIWGLHHEESLQQQTHNESALKNMKPESEISPDNETLDLLSKETPQTPTACQEGTEETLTNLDKISEKEFLHAANSQQLVKHPATSVQMASKVNPEEFVSSKKAWKISKTSQKSAEASSNKTQSDRGPETQDQRLKGLESKQDSDPQTPKPGNKAAHSKLHVRLNDNAAAARMEALFPATDTVDCQNIFPFNVKSAGPKMDQQRMIPHVKHYTSGQMFTAILPDGTGQVYYPSGRLAILVAVAKSDGWFCVVVLEDKQETPRIQAVFTNGGQGTCYYENASIRVNLTSRGGIYCSDTGDIKKRWRWQDNEHHVHHVHAPPWKSLSLKLNPNLNIHIKSQERTYIAFTSGKCSIQLNVGVKSNLNRGKGLMMPEPDMFLRYLKQKRAEINVLLQNIQSLTTYQKTVSPQKVKPQQSLISQMEGRQLPVKRQQSAKKTP